MFTGSGRETRRVCPERILEKFKRQDVGEKHWKQHFNFAIKEQAGTLLSFSRRVCLCCNLSRKLHWMLQVGCHLAEGGAPWWARLAAARHCPLTCASSYLSAAARLVMIKEAPIAHTLMPGPSSNCHVLMYMSDI